jgi:DNA polymerase-3 subunit gamma/tau
MSYLALARKWRPKTFAELVGQEHVVKALRNALDSGRVHHAFLFTGTRGVGKTTIARTFAKSLNCETGVSSEPCGHCPVCLEVDAGRFVDLVEIDAASHTGVDDVRELIESAQYAPARGRYKVFLIDEVHMLSKNAFNALLKTLEEPPEHVRFLLATTDPQKLPVTVLSRCLQFNLRRLRPEEISGQMERILLAEGIGPDPAALGLLALAADGSMRDGLSLLDQAIAHGGGVLAEAEVRAMLGTLDQDAVLRLLEALAAGDGPGLFAAIEAVAAYVVDYGSVLDAIAVALHRVQLEQLLPGVSGDDAALDPARVQALAAAMAAEDVQLYYQIAVQGGREVNLAPTPRIGFEMSLLRMLAFRPEGEPPAATGQGPGSQRASAPAGARGTAAATQRAAAAPRPAPTPAESRQPAGAGTAQAGPARSPAPTRAAPPGPPAPAAASGPADPADGIETAPPAPPVVAAKRPPPTLPEPAALPADTADWMALLDRMGLRAGARQLADNCTVSRREDGALVLGLDRAHELMLNEGSRRQIEQALAATIGSPIRVRIEVAAAPGADTPAQRQAQARDARQSQAEARFASDPRVEAALAALGGELVPGSIRPV